MLSAFADQAALGLEKDRLLREAEGRRRQAGVLADLARDIGASLDVGAVLQRVADGARELCEAEAARIALREAGTDTLTFRYWAGTIYPGYRTLEIGRASCRERV